jgi:hypothetical protein
MGKDNNPSDLWPEVYGLKTDVYTIFSVPKAKSVGTNNIDNAISNLEFIDDEIQFSIQRKDFLDYLSSGKQYYMNPIADEYIGYSQERRFILFNYKNNTFNKYVISTDANEYINKVMVLDWEKRLFVFEIWHAWYMDHKKIIRIFYLNDKEQTLIAEKEFGTYQSLLEEYKWTVRSGCIFFYHGNTVEVYDENLKQISHALANYILQNQKKIITIKELIIHPFLPFAIIVDQYVNPGTGGNDSKLWVIRWEHPDRDEVLIPFFPYKISIVKPLLPDFIVENLQFSPDGKWLVFRDQSDWRLSDSFIAVPVEPDNPEYLGIPKLLGKHLSDHNTFSTTWSLDPTCFVASFGNEIYKWDLDKLNNIDED